MFKKMFVKANALLLMLFVNVQVFAQDSAVLPLTDDLTEEAGDSNLWDFGAYIIGGLVGLFLLALTGFAFIQSVASALTAFREWQQQKLDLSEMFMKVGVSIFLLAIIIVIIGFAYVNFPDS
ncbi:hypothetical protein KUL42_38860 [Alteromonas sp. KUL42]|uniref:hypothetical protein n=1 Tax=Alteromonas sp. KUL42 TaxID=2480797 RepID=UPI001036E9BE|nr:hypothetical protein [Alteromonas sp. KUL42]TAP31693.1 hypothetical protein EYR97_19585 [Alteromonas sp. KUL42]GEA09125.1 hypothetical protein KUL42_38860 [Alteromonas sp. KUL42]